jgi:tetratricopeptide (TPR) repeat protein
LKTRRLGVGLALILLVAPSNLLAAERAWNEVRSDHFVVVSDAGEKSARALLWELEQFRASIKSFWPWAHVDPDRPILVLAARDEAAMKALAPQYWEQKGAIRPAAVFQTGPQRHYIALRADLKVDDKGGVINPYHSAYWSYVALILRSSLRRNVPLWLFLGLTELMSNTIVRDTYLDIGRLIPWHIQQLRERARIPLRDVLVADQSSPWYKQDDKRPGFDAECWALVHYLMLGDQGAHRTQFDHFLALLLEGKTPAGAFEAALGNQQALESSVATYITRQLFGYLRVTTDLSVKPEAFAVRSLPAAEALAARAEFYAAMRRPAEARAAVDEAKKADPRLPASYEVDGMLLDVEGKTEEARSAYAKAMDLGSTSFFPYYRWAVLTFAQGKDDSTVAARLDQALDKTTKLNDRFAPAYGILAEVRLQLGRGDDALALASRSVSLDPSHTQNRLSLARVFWGLSRRDDALREAREGLAVAASEDERRAAQQLIEFFQKNATD